MNASLFPGQGSQVPGMGADLFGAFPDHVAEADGILGYSVAELCAERPEKRLRQTEFAQPALYVVGALSHLKRAEAPAAVAGHSLGEYCALFAAGVFDFGVGLRLVARRGALMATARPGGMSAVVGCRAEPLAEVLARWPGVDVANLNAPAQVVLSGPVADLQAMAPELEAISGVRVIPLRVSGAFHSRYMADSAAAFASALAEVPWRAPRIPVISNVTARPYSVAELAPLLQAQLTRPVRWVETVQLLRSWGLSLVEVGVGRVLTRLTELISADLPAPPLEAVPVQAVPVQAAEPTIIPLAAAPSSKASAQIIETSTKPAPPARRALGSEGFRQTWGLRGAYLAAGMGFGVPAAIFACALPSPAPSMRTSPAAAGSSQGYVVRKVQVCPR